MKLNMDKCVHISMNCTPTINFRNGQPMSAATQVTYLGGTITSKGCPRAGIQARLSKALGTAKKLITFWKDVKCDMKWKLQVYNAVIITQLTYALDSVYVSQTNGEQTRCISKPKPQIHIRNRTLVLE